jgi:hypothetical protein
MTPTPSTPCWNGPTATASTRACPAPGRLLTEPACYVRMGRFRKMKKLLELIVCFIHPLAVVLMWIDLATRRDMATGPKLAWAIFGLIPLVPFIYVLTGGDLW